MVSFFNQILSEDIIVGIFFVISFFLLGLLVKFIDDSFDEKAYPRKLALILAPITAIFWAYIMSLNSTAGLLLTAIIIGVFVKGKIDNVAFVIAVFSVYFAYFFMGDWKFLIDPTLLLILIIISIAGIIDEIGNDYIDKNNIYKNGFHGKLMYFFFEYRFFMKIIVFLFALSGFYSIIFFIAFFFWDFGYELVMHYTKSILAKRKFYYNESTNSY
jgi:hypothetical protein